MTITIGEKKIGPGEPPFFIAEISGNHNADLQDAIDLIYAAKESGADAVKIQTFTPDCLTLQSDSDEFLLKSGPWSGYSLYKLYQKTQTPFEWHERLFDYAASLDMILFSSPFSIKSLNFLQKFKPPAFKIASNEAHDHKLIETVGLIGKPVIISTGVSTPDDIRNSIAVIRATGNQNIVILYCVSQYPTPINEANLSTLIDLKNKFDIEVGVSDHSLGSQVAISATVLGARIIEKHFTLDRKRGGPDDAFSMEPSEFKLMKQSCLEVFQTLGTVSYPTEEQLRKRSIFTRQLWSNSEIIAGETLSWKNVKSIRAPIQSEGISASKYDLVIGSKARKNIAIYRPIKIKDIGE